MLANPVRPMFDALVSEAIANATKRQHDYARGLLPHPLDNAVTLPDCLSPNPARPYPACHMSDGEFIASLTTSYSEAMLRAQTCAELGDYPMCCYWLRQAQHDAYNRAVICLAEGGLPIDERTVWGDRYFRVYWLVAHFATLG